VSAVTVELGSGPFEMSFYFVAVGDPRYSDVSAQLDPIDTDQEAVLAGATMLMVGNWRSFTVEKHYRRAEPSEP
jgi:hypothetical protein